MKAIRVHEFGGPEVMRLEEVPQPQPGPGQVLVRVHASGVNPVDTYIRGGLYAAKPALPYTPGKDAAGVVEAVACWHEMSDVASEVGAVLAVRRPWDVRGDYAGASAVDTYVSLGGRRGAGGEVLRVAQHRDFWAERWKL